MSPYSPRLVIAYEVNEGSYTDYYYALYAGGTRLIGPYAVDEQVWPANTSTTSSGSAIDMSSSGYFVDAVGYARVTPQNVVVPVTPPLFDWQTYTQWFLVQYNGGPWIELNTTFQHTFWSIFGQVGTSVTLTHR